MDVGLFVPFRNPPSGENRFPSFMLNSSVSYR
jgi:hypothetical protein